MKAIGALQTDLWRWMDDTWRLGKRSRDLFHLPLENAWILLC